MVLLVATAVVGTSAGEKRNLATDAVLQLVMDHRGKPGFETISVGKNIQVPIPVLLPL